MSETTTSSTAAADAAVETVTYEKGSWQDQMVKSVTLHDNSVKARKRAGMLLWNGAQTAITEWLPNAGTDAGGENFAGMLLDVLGTKRKGDVSKMKTVALAVRNNGLNLGDHENLAKAYSAAVAMTKTVAVHASEDEAIEKAVEALTESAPKSASTPAAAAAVLLSKGVDGAVVAILDALGEKNFDAHRAFMRALSTEVAARVQAAKPKPEPKAPKTPKAGATKATTKTASAKAKPATAKAKPTATSASKGDPNKKALPKPNSAKAKPAPAVTEPVHAGDDTPDAPVEVEVAVTETPAKPAARRVPVRRGGAA